MKASCLGADLDEAGALKVVRCGVTGGLDGRRQSQQNGSFCWNHLLTVLLRIGANIERQASLCVLLMSLNRVFREIGTRHQR